MVNEETGSRTNLSNSGNSDVIAAIASPPGMGAVSLVRLSGAGVFAVAEGILRLSLIHI